jgi:YadA head domain repeat (2 copies)
LWIGVVEFAFVARTGAAAMLQRRAGGLVVRTRTVKAVHNRSRIHDIAVANEPIGIPISRRARLMGASALAGGALRSLAVAAGMAAVFGAAPAMAQCSSNAGGTLSGAGACAAAAATGTQSTAIGLNANATGTGATAYGNGALANGDFATATGQFSRANGSNATATGQLSVVNGAVATATGHDSRANGFAATATGENSQANGTFATAAARRRRA